MKRCIYVIAAGSVVLSGCTGGANIAISPSLAASTERLSLRGMGGGERGAFQLGSSEGRFTRNARQDVHGRGLTVRNYGGATFKAGGPEFGGQLEAMCDFEEEEHNVGAVTVAGLRFAYRCAFRRSGVLSGGLVLEEVPTNPGKILSGRTRAGEVHLNGKVLNIRPIHRLEGSRLAGGTPVGYAFDIEGKEVGAVDLNGLNKSVYAPPPGQLREAVVAASLALSVLWDPVEF